MFERQMPGSVVLLRHWRLFTTVTTDLSDFEIKTNCTNASLEKFRVLSKCCC